MSAKQQRMEKLNRMQSEMAVLISSTSSNDEEAEEAGSSQDKNAKDQGILRGDTNQPCIKRKRGRKRVLTPQLAAVLDRTKTSDQKATFVIAETAKSLGHSIEDLAVNHDSICRWRMKHGFQQSAALVSE